uniref:Ubiquitin-like domain-containing protein n=1 Tax=Elaeophora elaphi TaxID=1147741 RepID=A0A0R3RZ34_9BILA
MPEGGMYHLDGIEEIGIHNDYVGPIMTDSGSDEEVQNKINLKVKTTTEGYDITVPEKATVLKVKAVLSAKINQPPEKLCLIFSGKILKDHETLAKLSIKDGMAIHLVIRNAQRPSTAGTPSGTGTTSNAAMGGNPISGALGMAQHMMQNPEAIREMTNSPIVQSLLNNPDIIRSLIADNPQIQQVIESNPELGHLLNDPEVIRQTIEMVRNPSMFQELMRSRDQAIRNLQGIPGGQAALQRLYQDVQEPLLNSATSTFANNPFATLVDNSNNMASRSQRAGVENAEALPNPWGDSTNTSGSAPTSTGAGSGTSSQPSTNLLAELANTFGLPENTPMLSDPNAYTRLLQSEAFSNTMNMIRQNPSLLSQMLTSSPAVSSNMEQYLRNALPQFLNNVRFVIVTLEMKSELQNPEMLRTISNPRVLEAFHQIHTGMDTLRREAPQLLPPGFFPTPVATTTTPNTTTSDSTTTGAAPGTGTTTTTTSSAPTTEQAMMMLNLIRQMTGANLGGSTQPPEERYRFQLEQLTSMGFSNQEANIQGNFSS